MIKQRLLEFDYYESKLPLYLQNSDGLVDHFKIIHDVLVGMDNIEDGVIDGLCIFEPGYLDYINSLPGNNGGTACDILDKIGELYGVERTFDISYLDDHDVEQTVALNLNNEKFLQLIKGRVIQNCFDGSAEMAQKFYDETGLPIYFYTDQVSPGTCHMILSMDPDAVDADLEALFRSGLLTIMSLGIIYTHSIVNIANVLVWDMPTKTWNAGVWY